MTSNICAVGRMQSPINIISNNTQQCSALCDLTFYYRTSKCNIVNTGNDIILDYDTGSYITYNSQIYELNKIAFTIPASHTIDGFSYPAEIQLYHRSPDSNNILIISVFLDINDASSKSKMFFDTFTNILPKANQQRNLNTSDTWTIFHAIPEIKSFFSYKGSIPRSPCIENVQWIVFDNAVNCSTNFYDNLKKLIPQNARPIQKLNNRKVQFNANTNSKNNRNYGDQMRCYNDNEFRSACSKLTSNTDIVEAKSRQALLIVIAFCASIITLLLILWLVQQDFFWKTWEKLKVMLSTKLFTANIVPKKP